MRIALIHDARFPVRDYGGTERVVWWLAKGLHEQGVRVILVGRKESECPFAERVVAQDFSRPVEEQKLEVDLVHYFATPAIPPTLPHLVTVGGNGKIDEKYLINTVFVSRNHAQRHRAEAFVHNGIDPDDYIYSDKKERFLIFLAKASWKVKNVRGAMRLSRQAGFPLHVVGGNRPWGCWRRDVHWEGLLGGRPKAEWISRAAGLLFPVIWNEPFGLAVAESLMSGTPVIASRAGSLPELIPAEVGRLCETESQFLNALSELGGFSSQTCRDWAIEQFHYRKMTRCYLELYAKVLAGRPLNAQPPRALEPPETRLPILKGAGHRGGRATGPSPVQTRESN